MVKKTGSSHTVTRKSNNKLSPDKLSELESLFLMGGISSYQSAKQVGVDPKTSAIYFEEWAEKLVADEDHLTWATKEKFAKARYKEALTKRMIKVRSRLTYFENLLTRVITIKSKNKKREPNYELTADFIEKYEKLVRLTEIQYNELQQEYAAIDMMPPTEVLLQKEIERILNEKQSSIGN